MTKQEKRKSLSIIKLYKIAQDFGLENPKVDMSLIADFLVYINKNYKKI